MEEIFQQLQSPCHTSEIHTQRISENKSENSFACICNSHDKRANQVCPHTSITKDAGFFIHISPLNFSVQKKKCNFADR